MHSGGHPVQRPGERNLRCPYYNDCLDHAAKSFWEYFTCSECAHRSQKHSMSNGLDPGNHGGTSFEIPPSILKGILEETFV